MIKNVLWDFDGTLFDTYPALVSMYEKMLKEEYSIDFDYKQIYKWAKISLSFCAEKLSEVFNIDYDELRKKYNEIYRLRESTVKRPPFPFAEKICKKVIENGGRNFIVTHRDRRSLKLLLQEYCFLQYFQELVTRDNGFPPKPDPSSFSYLIEKYKMNKSETMIVGDRSIDLIPAMELNIKSCYFDPGGLVYENADYQIISLIELEDILFDTTLQVLNK